MKSVKSEYGVASNVRFLIERLWRLSRGLTACVFLRAPFDVAGAYLGVYLSSMVVSLAETGGEPMRVVTTVAVVSLALIAALTCSRYFFAFTEKLIMMLDFDIQIELLDVMLKGDYETNESPSGLTRLAKAMENCGSDNSGARRAVPLFSSLLAGAIGIISYAAILWRFDARILAAVCITTLGSYFIIRKCAEWTYKNKDAWKTDDRKLNYLMQNAGDFSKAKDIRLYGLSEWFSDVFNATLSSRMKWVKREQLYNFRADWLRALLSIIRDIVSYGLLVYLLFEKGMSGGDFVYYFGVVGGVAAWLNGIVSDFSALNRFSLGYSELREYINYPNRVNNSEGIPVPNDTFEIEFKNVCYRYENSAEDTIKNLSFTIHKGEKLAIVGLNGAGKTTLVKLMCGLYTQTSGEVLIDGQPVNAYNRAEFFRLFSVVFQDISLLPQSIKNNIAAGEFEKADEKRLEEALVRAGLYDKVSALPKGLNTRLIQSVHADGIDLSGGEIQKLALARALYKRGKALILDEPTASLDPIAESNIYKAYNDMTRGHTSVFVSHRLASTRFCDRILLIDGGEIREQGTHESLMRAMGEYYHMFKVQSKYYEEGSADEIA